MTGIDAIVLAGGRATRMGGVDKPAMPVGGASMLDTALAAAADCDQRVVVGPHRDDLGPDILQTREDPPGSGPVAAVAAGLDALGEPAPLILVLAADLPLLRADIIGHLLARIVETGRSAVCAMDAHGRAQYLVSVWQREALVTRLAFLGPPAGRPMKALMPEDTVLVALDGIDDCDTDDELRLVAASLPATALTLDVARDTLRRKVSRLSVVELPVPDAMAGALAEAMRANDALPRFDGSAMDGYAVAGQGPWTLRGDTGFAGGRLPGPLRPDTAVRIATGAPIPEGATGVLRDEFAEVDGVTLRRSAKTTSRDDIRRRGEDWQPGDLIAAAGTVVGPALISLAAATAVATVAVRGPVRATVLITGDEISAEHTLGPNRTRDSLGPVLPEYLTHCRIHTNKVGHLADRPGSFDQVIAVETGTNILVVVGGTGGGAADQLRAALVRARARTVVPRLRMRPGGSTIVAELPDGRIVFGLPGNPFAAIAVLLTLAPALVDGLTGRAPRPTPRQVRLANAGEVAGSVTRIVPAMALSDGSWLADPAVRTAHLGGLFGRDALAVVPPNACDNDTVEVVAL